MFTSYCLKPSYCCKGNFNFCFNRSCTALRNCNEVILDVHVEDSAVCPLLTATAQVLKFQAQTEKAKATISGKNCVSAPQRMVLQRNFVYQYIFAWCFTAYSRTFHLCDACQLNGGMKAYSLLTGNRTVSGKAEVSVFLFFSLIDVLLERAKNSLCFVNDGRILKWIICLFI